MTAPDVGLATAIVADLNDVARAWSIAFTAERTWTPLWIGETDLTSLRVLVNPWAEVSVEAQDRDSTIAVYSIDFGFAKRLEDQTIAEIDALRALVDAAMERYTLTDLTVAGNGKFVPQRRLSEYITFDPNRLDRSVVGAVTSYTGDFLSIFRVPYKQVK